MKRQRLLCAPRRASSLTLVVGAAALLVLGSCAFADLPARSETPLASLQATDEFPSIVDAPSQVDAEHAVEAAASGSSLDPRAVADDARGALDAVESAEETTLFSSTTGIERSLDASEIPEIEAALTAFHDAGYDAGFVMYDLSTRKGIEYNADEAFFSASTVKAPFVAFAVQDMVDEGRAFFDEEVCEDVIVDGTGVMATDDADCYDLQTVLGNTVVHSDNTGYALARERFGDEDFAAWCAAADVDASSWGGEWYPYYTPRDLAKLWLNIGAYVAEGRGGSAWCADALGRTDRSFLRQALGDRHAVLSKPGYETDSPWYDTGALNDAGLVLSDGGAYVVAIMSDADYDDEYLTDNEGLILDLADAIGVARDRLLIEGASL